MEGLQHCIVDHFPVLELRGDYSLERCIGDIIAGVTLGLTLVPQGIAFASLAGFGPQIGLYASFVGNFVYALMGTCPYISTGPTALSSILTHTYTQGTNEDFGVFLCFFSGIVQLAAGYAHLGFLTEYVSIPVMSGYLSGAAVIICTSQMEHLLGINLSANTCVKTWLELITKITQLRFFDTLLSAACILILVGMDRLKKIKIKVPEDEKGKKKAKWVKKTLWYVVLGKNATVITLASLLAFNIYVDKKNPLLIVGTVPAGLPKPQWPPFETKVDDKQYNTEDMFLKISIGLILVPFLGIVSNIIIVKTFADHKKVRATQEIIALGACNLVSSCFQSCVVGGSLSRSVVGLASGVETPLHGIFTGVVVIMTMLILTPCFFYIPKAAIGSVIVVSVYKLLDMRIFFKIWRTRRIDLIPLLVTFLIALVYSLEIGVVFGIIIDAILWSYYYTRYKSRPQFDIEYVEKADYIPHYEVHLIGGFHYPHAERVRYELLSLSRGTKRRKSIPISKILKIDIPQAKESVSQTKDESHPKNPKKTILELIIDKIKGKKDKVHKIKLPLCLTNILVIHCDSLDRVDFTVLETLKVVASHWPENGKILWCSVKPDMKKQLTDAIGDLTFFDLNELDARLKVPKDPVHQKTVRFVADKKSLSGFCPVG